MNRYSKYVLNADGDFCLNESSKSKDIDYSLKTMNFAILKFILLNGEDQVTIDGKTYRKDGVTRSCPCRLNDDGYIYFPYLYSDEGTYNLVYDIKRSKFAIKK